MWTKVSTTTYRDFRVSNIWRMKATKILISLFHWWVSTLIRNSIHHKTSFHFLVLLFHPLTNLHLLNPHEKFIQATYHGITFGDTCFGWACFLWIIKLGGGDDHGLGIGLWTIMKMRPHHHMPLNCISKWDQFMCII